MKKSGSKEKIKVSFQEQYDPHDFRPALTQSEVDREKKQKIQDLKNKHQIVSFGAVE